MLYNRFALLSAAVVLQPSDRPHPPYRSARMSLMMAPWWSEWTWAAWSHPAAIGIPHKECGNLPSMSAMASTRNSASSNLSRLRVHVSHSPPRLRSSGGRSLSNASAPPRGMDRSYSVCFPLPDASEGACSPVSSASNGVAPSPSPTEYLLDPGLIQNEGWKRGLGNVNAGVGALVNHRLEGTRRGRDAGSARTG